MLWHVFVKESHSQTVLSIPITHKYYKVYAEHNCLG